MDKKLINKLIAKCEDLGWKVDAELDSNGSMSYSLSQYTAFGQDYEFTVDAPSFVNDVVSQYDNFDIEGHVYAWLKAKHNGVDGIPSIFALCDDGKEIDEWLYELQLELREVESLYTPDEDICEHEYTEAQLNFINRLRAVSSLDMIEDFLGQELWCVTVKELNKMIDEVLEQMPDDVLDEFVEKYAEKE